MAGSPSRPARTYSLRPRIGTCVCHPYWRPTLGFCAGLEVALQHFRTLQAADGIECWDDQYIDDG
eukprot:335321-Amphidinium_carterae.1